MTDTKRLLLLIFVVLWCLCSLPFAHTANTIVVKKKVGGGAAAPAGGCSVSDNEVGSRSEGSGSPLTAGYAFAFAATSDCSNTGTLETAYINHLDTSEAAAKVCVYERNGSTPGASDDKIGCSGEILSSTTTGWKTGSIGSGTVTASQNVWVVILVNQGYNNWQGGAGSSTTLYYQETATFSYTDPPSAMGTGWTDLGENYSPFACYVRLQ